MTQLNQFVADNARKKARKIFQKSGIEDWVKYNHTFAYVRLKIELEPLMTKIFEHEFLNSELINRIDELYKMRQKYLTELGYIKSKSINESLRFALKFLRVGLSLFLSLSIYTIMFPLSEKLNGSNLIPVFIAIFSGCSLTYWVSAATRLYASYYYRHGIDTIKVSKMILQLFLLLIIISLEGVMGSYGIYSLTRSINVIIPFYGMILPPILFSLINILSSFMEGCESEKRDAITLLMEKYAAIKGLNISIKELEKRIKFNSNQIDELRKKYDEILKGSHEDQGILSYLHLIKSSFNINNTLDVLYESANSSSNQNNFEIWKSKLVSNPDILGGETVFPGSRLSVQRIGGSLEQGETVEVLREDYPYLTDEDFDFARIFVKDYSIQGRHKVDEIHN
jgi:uncharacterized protein (DUF433 family)